MSFAVSGLQRGDHVASLLGNRQKHWRRWAAYRCGLYLTPIATSLARPRCAYLVDDCDARAVSPTQRCSASRRRCRRRARRCGFAARAIAATRSSRCSRRIAGAACDEPPAR
jgi:hypothetical protein